MTTLISTETAFNQDEWDGLSSMSSGQRKRKNKVTGTHMKQMIVDKVLNKDQSIAEVVSKTI